MMSERERTSAAQGRAADETSKQATPKMDQWAPPQVLELPPDTGDYVYRWIAESVNGHSMARNVGMRMREGYERVNFTELPEGFSASIDENTSGDNFCRTGGLILCRIPRKFVEQRNAYYKNRRKQMAFAADQLQGVAGSNAILEDRGSRQLEGAEASRVLQQMSRS